jgi:hypothetical protein
MPSNPDRSFPGGARLRQSAFYGNPARANSLSSVFLPSARELRAVRIDAGIAGYQNPLFGNSFDNKMAAGIGCRKNAMLPAAR